MSEISKIERKGIIYNIKDATARELLLLKYTKPTAGIPVNDLSVDVRALLDAARTALLSYTETDPTVPSWAKQPYKPSYTASEISGLSIVAKTGSYNDLLNKPQLPTPYDDTSIVNRLSVLENAGFITSETDPTVPAWAKSINKPSYTAQEVGALPASTQIPTKTSQLINDSNFPSDANYIHTDNNFTTVLKEKLNNTAERVELEIQNKPILADVATSGDYNDLINKPSIPSGYDDTALSNRVTALETAGFITSYTETDPTVPSWAKASSKPTYTASEVGALPVGTFIPTKVSDLTNDSNFASTSYVDTAVAGLVDSAPGTLDTLNELAAALGDDPNFATTVATLIGSKANASDVYTKSEIDNAGYLTLHQSLSNYYTKSQVDNLTEKTLTRGDGKLLYNGLTIDAAIANVGISSSNNLLNNGFNMAIRSNSSNPFFGLKEGNNLWYALAAGNYFYFGPTSAKALRLDQAGNGVFQTGSVTANSFIKKDGTSSQFLKADGSVDSNVYLTSHLDISGKANTSDLAEVATSGSYNDLTDKPTIPSAYNDTALSNRVTALENAGFLTSETDPSVPSWAKQSTKPTYTASEVGALPSSTHIPADPVNADWNATSGLAKILNKPTIPTVPTNISAFNNDAGYLTSFIESDPTVPAWAKATTKPSYTASEVGALPDTTVIPTKTSQLTNDSGFLTSHQDISGKQDALTASNGIAIDNNDAIRTIGIPFGICDSTSTSTNFTVTIPGIDRLEDGVCIMVKNGVVTSAKNFTLNVNGLGAKHCYTNLAAATAETTIFNAAYTMMFVYDSTRVSGGGWICYRGIDTNTNTIGYLLRTNSTTMNVSDTSRYYKLFFTSADGTMWVPASVNSTNNATSARPVNQRPINPFGRIVYTSANSSYAAGANLAATTIWDQYVFALGYSFNRTGAALELTVETPVYVKCAPQADGSAIMDADTPIVQALPSTNDGKIYIYLGVAYSATNIELFPNHPVYYHDGSGIKLWTGSTSSSTDLSNYYTKTEVDTALSGKQATLVSGTNLKTVNSTSLLGSGNVSVQPTLVSGTNIKTINNESLLGSGNISIQGGGGSANIEYNSSKTALVIGGGSTKYTISLHDPESLYPSVKINDFTYSVSRFPLEVNSGDILNIVVSAGAGNTCTTTMGGTTVSTSTSFSIQSVSGNIEITVASPGGGPGGDGPIVVH